MARRLSLLVGLFLVACSSLGSPTPAVDDAESSIKNYPQWTRANPEPLKIPNQLWVMCALPPPDQQARLTSPHSDHFSNVYVNAVGVEAMAQAEQRRFPVGSVIVKEKLLEAAANAPEALGIMIKRAAGFNPSGDDWEYLYWTPTAGLQRDAEAARQCQACHTGVDITPELEDHLPPERGATEAAFRARDSVFTTLTGSPTP